MFKKSLLMASALFIFAAVGFSQGTTGTAPAASTEKPKKPPIFRATKDQIKQVQTMLKDKKLYTGEVTGQLNDETRTAIKSVQKEAGIRETGTLNRATLEKMGIELTDKQKAIPVTESSLTPVVAKEKKPKAEKTTSASTTGTSSTTDKPKRPAPFRATSDQVKAAQKLLKEGKMFSGEETGKFDDAFRDGLGKYQEANGLKVTRTLNAVTLEKMGIELTDKQKADAAAAAPKN